MPELSKFLGDLETWENLTVDLIKVGSFFFFQYSNPLYPLLMIIHRSGYQDPQST